MRIRIFHSLGVRLFFLMSMLTLITVAGIAYQNIKTFKEFLDRQVQDQILAQANTAAADVQGHLENWTGQLAVAVPAIKSLSKGASSEALTNLLKSSPEYAAVQLLTTSRKGGVNIIAQEFTRSVADPRFEEQKPDATFQKISSVTQSWLGQRVTAGVGQSRVLLHNLGPDTKVPLLNIALRFDVTGASDDQTLWAVLTVWQHKVLSSLPKSRFVNSSIVDRSGRVFASPLLTELISTSKLPKSPLLKSALAGTSPAGYQPTFTDPTSGKAVVGAYASIPKQDGLSVLVLRDADAAFAVLKRTLMDSILWAMLFILISVAVSFVASGTITSSLRSVALATQKIASGDFGYRIQPKSKDEVGALSIAVNTMSSKILELLTSQVERAHYEKELETARVVQSTFFPKQDISKPWFKATGHYTPASQCGGDLWGHFTIGPNVEMIFVADAMGHGAPAALVTAMAYSACVTIAEMLPELRDRQVSPATVLSKMNRTIFEAVEGKISMTAYIVIIDFNIGEMACSNAGHNFPLLIPAHADDPRLATKVKKAKPERTLALKLTGSPLGISADAEFQNKIFKIAAGDRLFLYTDGLIECDSPKGECWGKKTLVNELTDIVTKGPDLDTASFKGQLVDRVYKFFGNMPQKDDVTLVVAEISRDWAVNIPLVSAPVVAENTLPPPPPPIPPASGFQQKTEAGGVFTASISLGDLGFDANVSTAIQLEANDDKNQVVSPFKVRKPA